MIKVYKNKNHIVITGHANYANYGKDIVCASCSSIVITSINAALRITPNSINYKEEQDKLIIDIVSDDKNVLLIMENMLEMLNELSVMYEKNIKIIEEGRP